MTTVLLNISGPYAVGKDTALNHLLEKFGARLHRVSTLTTRRVTASDPSYTQVGTEEFLQRMTDGNWIYNEQLDGQVYYGTSIDEIREQSAAGKLPIHSVFPGPQGAGQLREKIGSSLFSVALLPPGTSLEEQTEVLSARLLARGRETAEQVAARTLRQVPQLEYINAAPQVDTQWGPLPVFDTVIVNADLRQTLEHIEHLVATLLGDQS